MIETFNKFAEWLETAAIAPANKTSFWTRLFGHKPTRPPFDKGRAQALSGKLRQQLGALRELLFSEDDTEVQSTVLNKEAATESDSAKVGAVAAGVGFAVGKASSASAEISCQQTSKYTHKKVQHLHRNILEYQAVFREMASLFGGDAYLILDDLHHIPRRYQAQVLDYFHRIAKGNNLWLKVGTIRHRTQHGDPPVGVKIGDDISEVDLDLTLEKYRVTSDFLKRILDTFLKETNVDRGDFLARNAFDRLVLASGGVARDFLGLLRRSILIARERGTTARGEKVVWRTSMVPPVNMIRRNAKS